MHKTLLLLVSFMVMAAFSSAHAEPQSTATKAIQNIVGKDAGGVEAILGKPSAVEKTKYGPKRIYISKKSGVSWEIVFINGKADWITITPGSARPVPFDDKAITAIGLPQERPKYSTLREIRWENIQGIRSITFFPNGRNVGYCYVKVTTE